jgi:hypothetical protein
LTAADRDERIDPYLEMRRNISTSEGACKYLLDVAIETLITRRWDD